MKLSYSVGFDLNLTLSLKKNVSSNVANLYYSLHEFRHVAMMIDSSKKKAHNEHENIKFTFTIKFSLQRI